MKKKNKLFSAFDPVSAKAFKQKIQVDLKGADYNDTLIWNSPEGVTVKPYYHSDEQKSITTIPGLSQEWNIGEALFLNDMDKTLEYLHKAIQGGAETIVLTADATFDYEQFFKQILQKQISFQFHFNFINTLFLRKLKQYADKEGYTITIYVDLIGRLAREGNWFQSNTEDHKALQTLLNENIVTLSIDISLYENSGAHIVQQLAYGLAHANEYFNFLEEHKLEAPIHFKVSLGHNYFFEIAKLRALRQVYACIAEAYNLNTTCTITAYPTLRNKTIYDYNTNMLRTTTECMSAVIGGANTVVNLPYDVMYHKTNDFGQRISRNQLLILKKESYFDAVTNPSDGSYYIETITQELAEKSLTLFKGIEKNGGFLSQLKAGTIQRKIKESAQKEEERFDQGERILLGTNKHPNVNDRMKDHLELYPFVKIKPRKTIITPIIPKRLAEAIEQERLKQEV